MTLATIIAYIVIIALVVFTPIAYRSFQALGDRIGRQDKIITELRVDGARTRSSIWVIEKKMRDGGGGLQKLDALILQIGKKNAENAEAYIELTDEVRALRQMRGAKR